MRELITVLKPEFLFSASAALPKNDYLSFAVAAKFADLMAILASRARTCILNFLVECSSAYGSICSVSFS